MGKFDIEEREYFRDKTKFSNIFNYFLYNGENVINGDDLEELDTKLILTNPDITRERDIFKRAIIKTDGKKTYLLLGIENQTKVSKDMVIRIMGYDYFSYYNQIQNVEKNIKHDKIKLYPVITLVIYYSYKKWNGPKDLYSMFDIKDEIITKYVDNHRLNLIEPYNMTDTDFNKLNNDLSLLFEFVKNSGNKDGLYNLANNIRYKRIDFKTARLINMITNAGLKIEESDGVTDMCKAIEDMKKDSYNQGVIEGKASMCKAIEDMKKDSYNQGVIEGKASMSKEVEDMKKDSYNQGVIEGKASMSKEVEDMKKDSYNQGVIEGKTEGKIENLNDNIKTMYNNGFDVKLIAKALSLDINYVKKVLA